MPEKHNAIASMVSLLALYPADARIFVNCWTWGYEPLLLALLRAWPDEQLHVDRYKRDVFAQLLKVEGGGELEPLTGRIARGADGFQPAQARGRRSADGGGQAPAPVGAGEADRVPLKLHACHSRQRCQACYRSSFSAPQVLHGAGVVVAVNPAEMRLVHWDLYEEEVRRRLAKAASGEGDWPISLVRPLVLHF